MTCDFSPPMKANWFQFPVGLPRFSHVQFASWFPRGALIPWYHIVIELLLLVWVIWFLFRKSYNPKELQTFKENEENERIANWIPEPLVADVLMDHPALQPRVVENKVGNTAITYPATKYIMINGELGLNLASQNYLGLVGDKLLEQRAVSAVKHYGVGSCGPRGFYGTVGEPTLPPVHVCVLLDLQLEHSVQGRADKQGGGYGDCRSTTRHSYLLILVDIHLDLEEKLAKFMNMEEAVVYSYGFSTVASAIPAYAKRNDVLYIDEKANFAIQKGVDASRSKALYFKHNDVEDLERILEEEAKLEAIMTKVLEETRMYLFAETSRGLEQFLRDCWCDKYQEMVLGLCLFSWCELSPKKKKQSRRKFLVIEGIYMNTGRICPLPRLVELAKKYKLRIFLDESISFGTLGAHGRGVTEYFGVSSRGGGAGDIHPYLNVLPRTVLGRPKMPSHPSIRHPEALWTLGSQVTQWRQLQYVETSGGCSRRQSKGSQDLDFGTKSSVKEQDRLAFRGPCQGIYTLPGSPLARWRWIDDVDMIMGSMEWSMASIGGFCIGSSFVIEHQRLSGLGYCFSASLPPLLAAAAICSLNIMDTKPELFTTLGDCCRMMHSSLSTLEGFQLEGDEDSPVKHLYLKDPPESSAKQLDMLNKIVHFVS
ncbi:hypothetical protein PR048_000230 [Dryococelus australis]|uniref:Serine palmitoyltransferase 1 n=1 Tax=Dryococelus australis TaxID=614101 RepID=A0ABQ9IGA3_9NEOP|nr:hypothetical protein PR048_000230 [Dryococelus australis]